MRRFLAVWVLLLAASVAGAQGEDGAVDRVTKAYAAAESRDASSVAAFLSDARWPVRRFAYVRLRAMGMPEGSAEAIGPDTLPTAKGAPGAEALAAVQAWAATVEKEKEPPAFRPERIDAVMALCSILEEELRFARRDPALARGLGAGLLDLLAECRTREERAFVADRVLAALEGERVLKELGLPGLPEGEKEFDEACARLKAWFAENSAWLYLHPGERRLRLDEAARAAKVPTDEFRKATPWGEKEGPNAPAERAGPTR